MDNEKKSHLISMVGLDRGTSLRMSKINLAALNFKVSQIF